MVEQEEDVGSRSRSVSRCESRSQSRSQSRRSSVMSVRSEDDLDCSWRVWRSSRRRLSIMSSWFEIFSIFYPKWEAEVQRGEHLRRGPRSEECRQHVQVHLEAGQDPRRPQWDQGGSGQDLSVQQLQQVGRLDLTLRDSVLHSQDKARLKMLEDHVTKHSLRSQPHTMCSVCTRILEGVWIKKKLRDISQQQLPLIIILNIIERTDIVPDHSDIYFFSPAQKRNWR